MNGNILKLGFSHSSVGKESPAMQETLVRSLGWEYPLEQRKAKKKKKCWKILQYSGPKNSMDYIVHGVAKSQT